MKNPTLKAQLRKTLGRGVAKLRREGILPANLYGAKIKSQALALDLEEFAQIYKQAGETTVLDLKVGKTAKPVLISNLQKDPVSDEPIHVDLRQVDLTKKITATIPVEVIGESPVEKAGLGTLVQQLDEIEVEALPGDLPEKFEVDAEKLDEVDKAVLVKDLGADTKKVEVKTDLELIVAKVEPPQKEEAVAPPPAPEGQEAPEGAAPETESKEETGAEAPGAPAENKEVKEPES